MIIGVPREIKPDEYRVAVLPVGVELLVQAGHEVLVERGPGSAAGTRMTSTMRPGPSSWTSARRCSSGPS